MVPLYFRIHPQTSLMILPDTEAHLDGHTIITHTYSVFNDTGEHNPSSFRKKESILHLEKNTDPDYYGYITFEMPGKIFSYTANGQLRLSLREVEKVIEFLSHVRTNPTLWNNLDGENSM